MRRQDLNLRRRIMSPSLAALRLQCTPRQTFQTGYGGRIRTYINEFQKLAPFHLGHSVRILIWWTWHDLNVRPRPSQSRALIPLSYRSEPLAEATGLEPAGALRGGLANRCHTIRRRLQKCFSLRVWRKGQESNLQATMRGSFQDYCLTS